MTTTAFAPKFTCPVGAYPLGIDRNGDPVGCAYSTFESAPIVPNRRAQSVDASGVALVFFALGVACLAMHGRRR